MAKRPTKAPNPSLTPANSNALPLPLPTHPLLVFGYKSSPLADYPRPVFTSGYDGKRGDDAIAEKHKEFSREAGRLPYVSTFSEIAVARVLGASTSVSTFVSQGNDKAAVLFRNWLIGHYQGVWRNDLTAPSFANRTQPIPTLCGFDTKKFMRRVGVECVLAQAPLPLGFWFGNPDHRDVMDFLVIDEFRKMLPEPGVAAESLGLGMPLDFAPGWDAGRDLALACEILVAFGQMQFPQGKAEKREVQDPLHAVAAN